MKKVAIVGAGLMTQPLVDYFIDNCGYQVIVANRTLSKAVQVVEGKTAGIAVEWPNNDPDVLDSVIRDVDIVISSIINIKGALSEREVVINIKGSAKNPTPPDSVKGQVEIIITASQQALACQVNGPVIFNGSRIGVIVIS